MALQIILAVLFVVVALLFSYSLCVVAGNSDRQADDDFKAMNASECEQVPDEQPPHATALHPSVRKAMRRP